MTSYREFLAGAPEWLLNLYSNCSKGRNIQWDHSYDGDEVAPLDDGLERCDTLVGAEVMGSLYDEEIYVEDGNLKLVQRHALALDLDLEAMLIPSSTPGHSHFLAEVACTWEDYAEFLKAAAKIGLIEEGYLNVSLARKQTYLRLPWIRKGSEREDAAAAVASYLMGADAETPVAAERDPDDQLPF